MKPAKIARELRVGVNLVYTTIFGIKRNAKRVIDKAVSLAEEKASIDRVAVNESNVLSALDVISEADLLRKRDVKRQ